MNKTGYIKINSDEWEDAGKVYKVVSYFRRSTESTAVELELETAEGANLKRVVPYHWVEWIDDNDW